MNKPHRRTLFHSFADAFRGIGSGILSERNMRIHLTATCYVLFFALRLNLTRAELATLAITVGVVISAELMNTAVEKLCNFIEPRLSTHIRIIKDLAAGSVLVCALSALVVGCVIFVRPQLWQVLVGIFTGPTQLVLFIASLCIAWVFVFVGPCKILGQIKAIKKHK